MTAFCGAIGVGVILIIAGVCAFALVGVWIDSKAEAWRE